jgi:cobalt/nickel transport system ATP-binding protein
MDNSAIQVRGLTFAYPDSPPALRNVHFQVESGETIGLIGPNGAGKTTLFLCLAGAVPAPRKAICILGLDPADPGQRGPLPQKIGVVFQNSDDQFVNATVFDDVAFGPLNLGLPTEEVRERVTEALTLTGLAGLEERPPFHLSGGEKRRVALAGVLAMRPEILLLDEPTMFLDPRGRKELGGFLKNLPGTKIMATHDLEFVLQLCQRVLLLDSGELRADGKAREILSQPELMERHGLEVPHSLR